MPTYYVDPGAGSNTAPYDTWAKAATQLQTIASIVVAGDTVYMRGTENTTVCPQLSVDGTAASRIKWIGCNASGVVDGTRYVIDSGTNAINGLEITGIDYNDIENIELTSTSGAGNGFHCSAAGADYNTLKNIYVHNQTSFGFHFNANLRYSVVIGCRASNNGYMGFYRLVGGFFVNCVADGNNGDGWNCATTNSYIGCIAYGNTGHGIKPYTSATLINCVSHGNTLNGFEGGFQMSLHLGCRATANGGKNFNGGSATYYHWAMNCYSQSSGTGDYNQMELISLNEVDTNVAGGVDADYGYSDSVGNDFNLSAIASLRAVEYVLPDGINSQFVSAGLEPAEPIVTQALHPLAYN